MDVPRYVLPMENKLHTVLAIHTCKTPINDKTPLAFFSRVFAVFYLVLSDQPAPAFLCTDLWLMGTINRSLTNKAVLLIVDTYWYQTSDGQRSS